MLRFPIIGGRDVVPAMIRRLASWQITKDVDEAQSELDAVFGVDHVPTKMQQQQQQQQQHHHPPLHPDLIGSVRETFSVPATIISSSSVEQSADGMYAAGSTAGLTDKAAKSSGLTHVCASDGRAKMVDVSKVRHHWPSCLTY
jgi:hypothetical protein